MKRREGWLTKYDVFISHSRRAGDNEIALMIYQQLKQDYKVYLDLMIDENGRFDKRLEKHVKNCQDFILIVPKESIRYSSWVGKEVEWAMASGKNIIPIVLGTDNNLEERFPETLRDIAKINWIEYHEKQIDGIIKLIKKRMDTIPGCSIKSVCNIMAFLVLVAVMIWPICFVTRECVSLCQYILIESLFLIFSIYIFPMDSCIHFVFFIKKYMHINYKKQLVSYIGYEDWKKLQGCRGLKKEFIIEWCIRALCLPVIVIAAHLIAAGIFKVYIYETICRAIVIGCIDMIGIKVLYMWAVGCIKYEENCWEKNREIIVFCGTVDKSKLMDSKKFKDWIYQMCEEDVLFTVKGDFGLWETLYEIIEEYVEKIPDLEVKDFWIEEKNILKESKNDCFICFSYQKGMQYPPKHLIFADSKSMPEDKAECDNVKSMNEIDEIGKYVNIMKLKFYSEKVN